jgi:amino acid transporter
MQVLANILDTFGMKRLAPLLAALIAAGSIGTMINWIISPAKGLHEAGKDGFLPRVFVRKNRRGVAHNILIAQALLVSLFSMFFFLEPNINGYFWFLTALSTELYMLMYLLMFCSAFALRYKKPSRANFQIPGRIYGLAITCGLGIIGSLTTIVVSFFPPTRIENIQSVNYLLKIGIGNLITLSPVFLLHWYSKNKKQELDGYPTIP